MPQASDSPEIGQQGAPLVYIPVACRPPRIEPLEISRGRAPGRGLLYSSLLHEIAIFALLLYPTLHFKPSPQPQEKRWKLTMIPKAVLYLPQLGGGSEGGSGAAGAGRASPSGVKAPAAPRLRGMTYAGPQEIVSNPANPTNHLQTVLQPQLPNPPIFKMVLPVPNMVMLAPSLPPSPPAPKVSVPTPAVTAPVEKVQNAAPPSPPKIFIPTLQLAGPEPLKAPQLTLPPIVPEYHETALLPALNPPPAPSPPKPVPAVEPAAPPKTAVAMIPLTASNNVRSLLVLSPIAVPPNAPRTVPPGEARGQFSISPLPSSNLLSASIGSLGGIAHTGTMAISNSSSSGSRGRASVTIGGGSGAKAGPAGPGSGIGKGRGAGLGAGNGAGSGVGKGSGSGKGPGTGSGTGNGAGSGAGNGSGNGRGEGIGPGQGSFPGISIQGAEGPAGAITIQSSSGSSAPSGGNGNSYGLTIISAGNSGGGVEDFGVFHDEAVFTVYMKPEGSADDPSPSWPLQYALLDPKIVLRDLVPPFPIKKPAPKWPQNLASRYDGQQVVVYALILTDGKMQGFRILQSPNPSLSSVLLATLKLWLFQPASMDGVGVAVKVVLGVPVSQN